MIITWSDSFESGTLGENWTNQDSGTVTSSRSRSGSYAAVTRGNNTGTNLEYSIDQSGTLQSFEFYFYEESSNNTGGGVEIASSSGRIIAFESNNPQWDVWDSNGWSEVYGGDGYQRWVHVEFHDFDWSGGTCDVRIEDPSSGYVYSDTHSLGNTSSPTAFRVQKTSRSGPNSHKMWWDDFHAEFDDGGSPGKRFDAAPYEQTFTVPDGVSSVDIECTGGAGADGTTGNGNGPGSGGQAGYATGTLSVSQGEMLHVYTGKAGDGQNGGYHGGGDGKPGGSGGNGGGGGGASDVRYGGATLDDRVIVGAGGGGGGGGADGYHGGHGGDGGGLTGNDGYNSYSKEGYGGTQSSGGEGGSSDYGSSGYDGSFLDGGGAADASNSGGGGGGGGGGWYGGGGGGQGGASYQVGGGGGGGSSYVGGVTSASTSSGGGNGGDGQVVITYYEKPAAPSNVTATVNDDDSITLSWDKNTSGGPVEEYEIQMTRDGSQWIAPEAGPSTVTDDGSSSYSVTITPANPGGSTRSYDRSPGVDSEFDFRVRQTNATTNSDWKQSGAVYTTPLPPLGISVNRPDGNTVDLSWTNRSTIENGVEIQYREDDGSGIGSWTTATTRSAGATTATLGTAGVLSMDARYQLRLCTVAPDDSSSAWVFADYGTSNNVYFSDDFSSGDAGSWDTTSFGTGGVVSTLDSAFAGTASEVGGFAAQFGDAGHVQTDLGDLSDASDVHVRVRVQTASNDSVGETGDVWWYDGSTWQNLAEFGWEYDQGCWLEFHATVPASYLAADNRIRIGRDGGGGADWVAFDEVVVADVLDEYTTPVAPSDVSLDTSTEDEITASWSDTATFEARWELLWKKSSESSWNKDASIGGANVTQYTLTGLRDGEEYDVKPRVVVEQPRRGAQANALFWADGSVATGVTELPAPTDLTVSAVNGDQATVSWTPSHDYGNQRVEVKPTDSSSWSDDSGQLSKSANSYTTTNLRDGEEYDLRVVAYTEHTEEVDQ